MKSNIRIVKIVIVEEFLYFLAEKIVTFIV